MQMGSDWPNCRSVADLAPSNSMTEQEQKLGRLGREPERGIDKKCISYAIFLCRTPADGNDEDVRKACNSQLARLLATLLMEYELVTPNVSGTRTRNPAFDWPGRNSFLQALLSQDGGTDPKTCVAVARILMDEMSVPDDIRKGLEAIVRHINRPVPRSAKPRTKRPAMVSPLDELDLDEVRHGLIGTLMAHTTGRKGGAMFDRFRALVRKLPPFTEEQVVVAFKALGPDWWLSCDDTRQIPGLPPGTTCQQLYSVIKQCYRGFTRENDSLVKMLKRHGVLPPDPPDFTEEQVVAALKALGPNWWSCVDTRQIPGLPPGTTCKKLDSAIRQCNRGFARKNDSLPKMLKRHNLRRVFA